MKTNALSGVPRRGALTMIAVALTAVSVARGADPQVASYSGVSAGEAEAGSLSLSAPVVRQVQLALGRRGYYTGAVTAFMGYDTQIAIQTFQVDHGLRVWPLVDRRLLASLGIRPGGWAVRNRPF